MSFKFIILGCGSSLGVPRIDGYFGQCDPNNKKNYRSRCSGIFVSKKMNILFDASPDLKNQLLRNKIKNINKVFFSHSHADQTHGINELRYFYIKNKKKIPIFANKETKKYLFNSFNYCFKKTSEYPPILKMTSLKKIHNFYDGSKKLEIRSINVKHGKIESAAYILNKKCAYLSDANKIYEKDIKYFKNLKYLIVDCLREKFHPSHFNLKDVINLKKILNPYKTILTNMHSDLDYKSLRKKLPKSIYPAFDGMTLDL